MIHVSYLQLAGGIAFATFCMYVAYYAGVCDGRRIARYLLTGDKRGLRGIVK